VEDHLQFREMVARATPLHDRLLGLVVAGPSSARNAHTDVSEDRLKRWREILGGHENLRQRLTFESVHSSEYPGVLGAVHIPPGQPIPTWAEDLQEILKISVSIERGQRDRALRSDDALAFEELFLPFLAFARREITKLSGNIIETLSSAAQADIERLLVCRLSTTSARVLLQEFQIFRLLREPLRGTPLHDPNLLSPVLFYRQFTDEMRTGGLRRLLVDYAVLGRLVAIATRQWVEFVLEFCRRLNQDLPDIQDTFNEKSNPGLVTRLGVDLSDMHRGGRCVLLVTFASGLRLMYKPKDLGVDHAFYALVNWVNAHGLTPSLRSLTILNRLSHGWVEYIDPAPCADATAIDRYYRRAGMLLCLTHVLGGTDLHCENLVANGEHPVLIDLETLLQPQVRSKGESADFLAEQSLCDSALRTLLLPTWSFGNSGRHFDISGFGAEGVQETDFPHLKWRNINTDDMILSECTGKIGSGTNCPMFDGAVIAADTRIQEIIEGFVAMYEHLEASRHQMLSPSGPMSEFRALQLRYIFRSTPQYGLLSRCLLEPKFLRDGADRSIEMEQLARLFVGPGEVPTWTIYGSERTALEQLDIPYFSFASDNLNLMSDGEIVANEFFRQTGFNCVLTRLRHLCLEDLQRQVHYIRTAMFARYGNGSTNLRISGGGLDNIDAPSNSHYHLTRSQLIAAAENIAEQISMQAFRGADGSITWVTFCVNSRAHCMSLQPMGFDLYDGRIGVSLFLAALDQFAPNKGYRELALAAIKPLLIAARSSNLDAVDWQFLGRPERFGNELYGLVSIARLITDDNLVSLLDRLLLWFAQSRIDTCEIPDILGGLAGRLLGMLAARPHDQGDDLLERAFSCGDHLLTKLTGNRSENRPWRLAPVSKVPAGFAHGTCGIAYALCRLSQVTGHIGFRQAAQEIFENGTSVSPEARGETHSPQLATSNEGLALGWCRGASGVGLARLGGLHGVDTALVRKAIDHALNDVLAAAEGDADHLCCGGFGRIEFLLEAGRRLGRLDLVSEAKQRATLLVHRAARQGAYSLNAHMPGVFNPSFFHGSAGIGYTLLRLAEPECLPCALLLG
jgi:type 2 lantibiotic biosynthesis protein LanM